jgi:hypothetical protein
MEFKEARCKECFLTWCYGRGDLNENNCRVLSLSLLFFESFATSNYVCKLDKALYELK